MLGLEHAIMITITISVYHFIRKLVYNFFFLKENLACLHKKLNMSKFDFISVFSFLKYAMVLFPAQKKKKNEELLSYASSFSPLLLLLCP